jgi:hypothetical protein
VLVFLYSAQDQDVGYYGALMAALWMQSASADVQIINCGPGLQISCNCPSGYVLTGTLITGCVNIYDQRNTKIPTISGTGISCDSQTYHLYGPSLADSFNNALGSAYLFCAKVCQ